jgi:hypothetical protein
MKAMISFRLRKSSALRHPAGATGKLPLTGDVISVVPRG